MSNRIDTLSQKTDTLEKLYGAQLLWKIDNYQQKYNEAKAGSKVTIFSPPFMTGRHGYKMALSACLFGDGKGTIINKYSPHFNIPHSSSWQIHVDLCWFVAR